MTSCFFIVPKFSIPMDLAIWTAYVPTPPEAPLMRTRCPARTCPRSRMTLRAVKAETPTAAACSKEKSAGLGRTLPAGVLMYSAKAPSPQPKTSSPGATCVTPAPTASTTPAMSVPLHWTDENLPIGMMFGARCGNEWELYQLAGQLERAAPWAHRRPPIWTG